MLECYKYCFAAFALSCSLECSSQVFIENGIERGIDVTVTAQEWGSGVSTYDFNQDGYDDLTIGSDGEVLFFVNDGMGYFSQVFYTVATPNGSLKAIVWADIDNDGDPDLLMTGYFGDVRLNKNIGNLVFQDITADSGLSMDFAGNYGLSLSDIDKDGFLDIQLCRYSGWVNAPENPSVQPERWTRLYHNNGDGTFSDITLTGGMVIDPRPVFQGVFSDFNNDGWPDNYSIVDRLPGNKFFTNDHGEFTDVTEQFDMSYPSNDWMSNSVADFDNDGYLDIFMTNGLMSSTGLIRNIQGSSFQRIETQVGLAIFEFGWGAQWIDFDNDGWQDLFFATESTGANRLFSNQQGLFTDISLDMELDEDVLCYSVAKGDFDNDGFYDLMVQSRFPSRSLLMMNQEDENHFIKVTPHGTVSNRDAIGTWLRVYSQGDTYVHFTSAGDNYISQNSQHWIFGLDDNSTFVDSLEITYPSGHTDTYYDLPVDSNYYFLEGSTYLAEIESMTDTVCIGEEVLLDAGSHSSYSWSTSDTTQTITVTESGLYAVTVTNEFGISTSAEIEIVVLESPFIEEIITNNPCFGDSLGSIQLNNLSQTGLSQVIWTNGQFGETLDSLLAGEYHYQFIDQHGCSTLGSVTLSDLPELSILYDSSPETGNSQDGSIELLIFGGLEPYVIVLNGDTVPSTTINGLSTGNYSLIVYDQNGCLHTIEVFIDQVLSTFENHELNIPAVFPNPTDGPLRIEHGYPIRIVSIYDARGAIVKKLSPQNSHYDLGDLNPGIYFIQLIDTRSVSHLLRLIKE